MSKQGVAKTQEYRKSRERAEDSVESALDLTGLVEKRNRKGTRYLEDENGEIVAKECLGECRRVKYLKDFYKRQARCKTCHSELNSQRYEDIKNDPSYKLQAKRNYKKYYDAIRNDDTYKEKKRIYSKEYRTANKERLRDAHRRWVNNNQSYKRAYDRLYRAENKDRIKLRLRQYQQSNKPLMRSLTSRRRARKQDLPDSLSNKEWKGVLKEFKYGCALTGSGSIHRDHAIPLYVGHAGTTYDNMYPLRSDLNISKSNRCIFDWFPEAKERFNLDQTKFDELIEYLAEINGMTVEEYEEYVRWCHDNPRTLEDLQASNTEPDAS